MNKGQPPQEAPLQPAGDAAPFDENLKNGNPPKKSSKRGGKRPNTGGKRPGSGRKKKPETLIKMDIQAELDAHLNSDVEVTIKNRSTGEIKTEKRKALRAVLDMLLSKAISAKDVAAGKEYLDRTVGKSPQAIKHSGLIGIFEQKKKLTPAELAAAAAYERAHG